MIKKYIKIILKLSVIKTIVFNFKYFGIKGIFVLPVLIGKYVDFVALNGKVNLLDFKTGIVQIGLNDIYTIRPLNSTYSTIENNGIINFKGKAILGCGTKISNKGIINFGNNIAINADTLLVCHKNITFGDNCLISWGTEFMDTDFHKIYDNLTNKQINENKEIVIGNNVWVTSGVKILKGVNIANGNIIAANSVVTKSIMEQNTIVTADKIIKKDIRWKL